MMYTKPAKEIWQCYHLQFWHQLMLVVAMGGLLEIWLAGATPRIAKPGCEDRCGNLSIPYPFGIGPNCYHNPWFHVECRPGLVDKLKVSKLKNVFNNSASASQINWEPVKGERTFVIGNSCSGDCGENFTDTSEVSDKPSYNLTGSPFLFSRKRNVLLVSGCGGGVLLRNKYNQTVAGCAAVCTNRSSAPGTQTQCYGIGCCQTTFPSSLDYYDFEFVNMALARPTNDSSSPCTYAVLVDSTWITNKSKDINFMDRDSEICGPAYAVLEWTVTDLPIYSPSYANSSCVNKNASADDAGGYICRCIEEFYEGNPYLPHGCQVVSECEGCVQECISVGNHTFGCRQKADKDNPTSIALGLGLGISFVVLLVLVGAYWLYHMLKRRRNIRLKAMYFEKNGGLLLKQQMPSEETDNIFTSDELEKATDQYNEDRVLGQGGQGTVYKGMLSDGKIVAIKKSKIVDESQLSVFINEVVILSQINHRNVVKLLGCCLETEVPMLVYEYVPNGTLSESIHGLKEDFPITWEMRLQIGTDIANALSYLHSSYLIPIYHRDIKSSNILLDTNYRAKLSDFGISKALGIDQTHITTKVVGTFGYLDPEYFQSNQFTDKSDVYSFGVVLVELMSGQKAIRVIDDEERGLVAWFLGHMEDSSLYDILDARVIREGKEEEIMMVAHLAKRCVNLDGKRRPTMKEVAAELETVRSSLQHGVTRNKSILSNDDDQLPSDFWIDSTAEH